MKKKKKIRLRTLLIIEVLLVLIGSFFIFRMEESTAESQKKEEILQELSFVKIQTNRFNSLDLDNQETSRNLMQAQVDSLVYAHEHIPDFEITAQIRNASIFGSLSTNPNQDNSRTYVTSTASDGTVYALDISDYNQSSFNVFEIADVVFPQLFESDDLYFIIDEKGTILDYPSNTNLEGKNISTLGLNTSQVALEDGAWLRINDKKYYTLATKDDDLGYIYVGATNENNFRRDNNFISALICLSVCLIIALLIIYIYFSRQEDSLNQELEKPENIKNRNPWVFGIIAILFITVVTYHLQSLFCFSMFNMVKQTESAILETWVKTNKESFLEQINEINEDNTIISDNIVSLISSYPELQTAEHISELSKIYSLSFIKVLDSQMNEVATTPITKEEYENFTDEIKNHYPIYPITPLDKLFNTAEQLMLTKKIGIPIANSTGSNTLLLGFKLKPYMSALLDLDLINILSAVSSPGDIETLTVNTDTKLIIHASYGYFGRVTAEQIGINDESLQDQHFDTLNLEGNRYYSITKGISNYIVFLLEPTNILFAERSFIVSAIVFFSTLCIAFLLYLMSRFDVTVLPAPESSFNSTGFINKLNLWDRFNNWQDKTAEEKVLNIGQIILNILVAVIITIIYFRNSLQYSTSLFSFIVSGEWQKGVNLFSSTAVAITCMIYAFVMNIIRFAVNKLLQIVNSKTETVLRLIHSFVIYISMIGLIFYCMYLFGMDSRSILASAGIIGLIISWGSQDLLTDILAGLFIIFEKQFHVNDMIEINGERGTVTEIGVRTTQIVTIPGDVLYISNRNLSKILNKTQTISNTGIILYIGYDQNIPEIENMLRKELPKLSKIDPAIISGPQYSGLLDFTDQYARLIVGFSSEERDKFRITCKLDSELCRLFDEHGFEMGIDPVELKK